MRFCLYRHEKVCERLIAKFADKISSHGYMDNPKWDELEKAYKNYKVRARMVAVRMVLVLDTAGTVPACRRRV